ncbi:MAG: hypothetical protein HOV97_26315 [Nonomuraea sp.]|nr:hypothetical protein [Nonomuraea sp.]
MTLRDQAGELMPLLVREAGRTFPGGLSALDAWTPPWERASGPAPKARPAASGPVADLLAGHPSACDAVAELLGCEGGWRTGAPVAEHREVAALLTAHPDTALALAGLIA